MMSPKKIGFIISLAIHVLVAVAIVVSPSATKASSSNKTKTMVVNLTNIEKPSNNQPMPQQKSVKKKKKKKKKPQPKKETNIPKEITETPQSIIEEEQKSLEEEHVEEDTQEYQETNTDDILDGQENGVENPNGAAGVLSEDSELYEEIKSIINKNNAYPSMAYKRNIQGWVEVEFVLFKDGNIGSIAILNNPHKSLEQGAINAIKQSYKKFPGVGHDTRIRIKILYEIK